MVVAVDLSTCAAVLALVRLDDATVANSVSNNDMCRSLFWVRLLPLIVCFSVRSLSGISLHILPICLPPVLISLESHSVIGSVIFGLGFSVFFHFFLVAFLTTGSYSLVKLDLVAGRKAYVACVCHAPIIGA